MPIKHLNPQDFALLKRSEQAEIIAREKRKLYPDYKLKSAYRYLQRAAAPEGKQRIVKPRLWTFLSDNLLRQVDRGIKIRRDIAARPPAPPRLTWEDMLARGVRHAGHPIKIAELEDKIAVLISQLNYEKAADALDVDTELLEKVVTGQRLNRMEMYEIDGQFSNLMRDEEAQAEYGIDADKIEDGGLVISQTMHYKDVNDKNVIRESIADNEIDLEKFLKAVNIFPQLENRQLQRILDTYTDQKKGITTYHMKRDPKTGILHKGRKMRKFDINEMFDAAALDDYNINNVAESEFWEWFRQLFY